MQVNNYVGPCGVILFGALTAGGSLLWHAACNATEVFGRLCPYDDYLKGHYSSQMCADLASDLYGKNIAGFVLKLVGMAVLTAVVYDIKRRDISVIDKRELDRLASRGSE